MIGIVCILITDPGNVVPDTYSDCPNRAAHTPAPRRHRKRKWRRTFAARTGLNGMRGCLTTFWVCKGLTLRAG